MTTNSSAVCGKNRPRDPELLEAHLIHRITQGDSEALGDLYDIYGTPLYSLAVHILGECREAEDVVRDVFLKIWERAPSLDKPFPWALALTRTRSIERLEARRSLPGFHQTTGNCVSGKAAKECFTANYGLTDSQRRSIALAKFSGFSLPQIAASMGESVSTIRSLLWLGMVRLRAVLERRN